MKWQKKHKVSLEETEVEELPSSEEVDMIGRIAMYSLDGKYYGEKVVIWCERYSYTLKALLRTREEYQIFYKWLATNYKGQKYLKGKEVMK